MYATAERLSTLRESEDATPTLWGTKQGVTKLQCDYNSVLCAWFSSFPPLRWPSSLTICCSENVLGMASQHRSPTCHSKNRLYRFELGDWSQPLQPDIHASLVRKFSSSSGGRIWASRHNYVCDRVFISPKTLWLRSFENCLMRSSFILVWIICASTNKLLVLYID